MSDEHFVSTGAIARSLYVSARTVRRWCEAGVIPQDGQTRTLGGHIRVHVTTVHELRKEKADKADK